MTMIALLEKPCAVRAILRHLKLPDTPIPVARSRGSPPSIGERDECRPSYVAGSAVARSMAAGADL